MGSRHDGTDGFCIKTAHQAARGMAYTDATMNALYAYWNDLRAGREAPFRSEIDPRKFEDALECMFILELVGEDNIRVRLAGMQLCEMMGMELRGMRLRSMMRVEDRAALDSALSQVLAGPSVGRLDLKAHTPAGAQRQAGMIMLPLRNDFGDVSRILGCLKVSNLSQNDGTPLRFSISASSIENVNVTRDGDPIPSQALPGFSEPAEEFVPRQPALRSIDGDGNAIRSARARGHLRVVDNE